MAKITDIQCGDKILYSPADIHALRPNSQGEYPWVVGWKKFPGRKDCVPREMLDKELKKALDFIARHPNPQEESKKLVLLRPRHPWTATIRKVNEGGGSVHVDVESNQGGFTLHYDNVPLDVELVSRERAPHTCHMTPTLHTENQKTRREVVKK